MAVSALESTFARRALQHAPKKHTQKPQTDAHTDTAGIPRTVSWTLTN